MEPTRNGTGIDKVHSAPKPDYEYAGFMDPESKKQVGKYSLGMRQRLGLAQALMENPDILLLDEPLSGLDNDGVQEMHELLMKQKEQGRLLIIASHSKEDIEVLCDEVFRFDKGKMIGHDVAEK